jgi:D-arabinose 1-dehydrogenase-like Zn-dependent alcohol dehydrogenase
VAGIVDEVGVGVSAWKKGQRVGVGWHGGQDNTCRECRRGDFRNCQNPRRRSCRWFQPGHSGRPVRVSSEWLR